MNLWKCTLASQWLIWATLHQWKKSSVCFDNYLFSIFSRKYDDTAKRWGVWPKKTFLIFESTSTGSVSRSSSHTSFKELFFLFCLGRRLSTLQSWSFFCPKFRVKYGGRVFSVRSGVAFLFQCIFCAFVLLPKFSRKWEKMVKNWKCRKLGLSCGRVCAWSCRALGSTPGRISGRSIRYKLEENKRLFLSGCDSAEAARSRWPGCCFGAFVRPATGHPRAGVRRPPRIERRTRLSPSAGWRSSFLATGKWWARSPCPPPPSPGPRPTSCSAPGWFERLSPTPGGKKN